MKDPKPLVSILLPVYKSEKFLADSVASLLAQSYKNIEIIAVVDYLRDDSLKILKDIRKKDKRLRIYANVQTYGLAVTLNRAARRAKGDFIAFMDTHGTSTMHRVARQVAYLNRNPKIGAVGTQAIILDEKGKRIGKTAFPITHEEINKSLLAGSMKFETVMINRKSLPRDILKFTQDKYPYLFTEVLLKINRFAELANLNIHLNTTRLSRKDQKMLQFDKKVSLLKLMLKSATLYDHKPSLRSFFLPILRKV